MAKKKSSKKKVKAKKNPAEDAPAEDSPAEDAPTEDAPTEENPKGKYYGQELNIKHPSGVEFKGLCVSHRKFTGGEQVYLKLNGCVSRWFSVKDIVE